MIIFQCALRHRATQVAGRVDGAWAVPNHILVVLVLVHGSLCDLKRIAPQGHGVRHLRRRGKQAYAASTKSAFIFGAAQPSLTP